MDEALAYEVVYSAIQEHLSEESISVLTEPTRGFMARFLAPPLYVDWYTIKVLLHKSSGLDINGDQVAGFWFEVSGSGSSFVQGAAKNRDIYNTIEANFIQLATSVSVTNIRRANYEMPITAIRVRGSDYLLGQGERVIVNQDNEAETSSEDIVNLINALRLLKEEGTITEEEYNERVRALLDRMDQ